MNEQKFQLEFERFKQKSNWENKIFFVLLTFIISALTFFIKEDRTNECVFWLWLAGLSLALIVGEFLISRYLNIEKKKFEKLIGEKR